MAIDERVVSDCYIVSKTARYLTWKKMMMQFPLIYNGVILGNIHQTSTVVTSICIKSTNLIPFEFDVDIKFRTCSNC